MRKAILLKPGILLAGIILLAVEVNAQHHPQAPDATAIQKKLYSELKADPTNLKLHNTYIRIFDRRDTMLDNSYRALMKHFPDLAEIPFAIGQEYYNREDPRAKDYLLRALKLKPGLAEAWYYLGVDAQRWGEYAMCLHYMQKAAQADPSNPDYALAYAYEYTDSIKSDSLLLDVTRRFPESESGARALFHLARESTNTSIKTAFFEQLYRLYSKHPTQVGRVGMAAYFDFLINTDPGKAFDLALPMSLNVQINKLEWRHKLKTAKSFIDAGDSMAVNKPEAALTILNTIDLNNNWSHSFIRADKTLLLMKAQAAAAMGKTQAALDSLMNYYCRRPSDKLYPAILAYGAQLGMDSAKIQADIMKMRKANAPVATPFTLTNYLTNESVSLDDFKGRIVLLTYWFPGCGPCRGEFPHFESVIRKFDPKKIAYLSLNVDNEQDEYVVPFVKSTRCSFIPLRDSFNRNKGTLPARSYPTNYLIDQEGRIIFSHFLIMDKEDERMLELMISELLNKDA